jgi:hypothetical protein
MLSNNDINDKDWTKIVKKLRKNVNSKSKPVKYIHKWTGNITKKDIILTSEEQELIKQEMLTYPTLKIFCNCCQYDTISDVIRRPFFNCNQCYCCLGDGSALDTEEYCFGSATFYKYNDDYHFTKDQDFYKN